MSATEVTGRQIKDGSIQRPDLDVTTSTKAVIAKVIAGSGVSLSSTGPDDGTGDVTITATGSSDQANDAWIRWRDAADLNWLNTIKVNSSNNVLLNADKTGANIQFQIEATSKWSINNASDFSPSDDNARDIGTGALRVRKIFGVQLATIQMTGTLDLNSNLITNLATPVSASDAVTKSYVDAITFPMDVKDSCRVASTVNITIASALTNGSTIDGVTVATGNRVLLKNQTAPAENGIYVVVASGAASRSTDADTSAEVTANMFVFISEGSTQADTQWVLTTNDPITLGSTSLTFAQFGTAPGTGIQTLNTLSVNTQTFATGSAGTDFAISSSGSTHTFNIPDASGTNRGLITTGSQTLAGVKTFSSAPNLSSLTASRPLKLDGSKNITATTIDLTSANDVNNGTANQLLGANAGATANEFKSLAVGSAGTDFAIAYTTGVITFNIPDASASNRGLITTGTQTIAGAKTFSTGITTASPITYTSTTAIINANTADASDNASLEIQGGGATGNTRGSGITLYGNEHANTGQILLKTGNVTGQAIIFNTSNAEAFRIDSSGNLFHSLTQWSLVSNTSDGSDSKSIVIAGGGGTTAGRGSYLAVFGNDNSGGEGTIELYGGDASTGGAGHVGIGTRSTTGQIKLSSNTTVRWVVREAGDFEPAATTTYNIGTSSKRVLKLSVQDIDTSGNIVNTNIEQGWTQVTDSWTYNAGNITIPSGGAAKYQIGDKVYLYNSGFKYFYVIAVADTLLTITGGSDYSLINAAISGIYISRAIRPFGFPTRFNYTPTWTGFSSTATLYTYNFTIDKGWCTVWWFDNNSGTSNTTGYQISLPVTAATQSNNEWGAIPWFTQDNGTTQSTPAQAAITSGGTTIIIAKTLTGAGGGWTASGNKASAGVISYPIAGA